MGFHCFPDPFEPLRPYRVFGFSFDDLSSTICLVGRVNVTVASLRLLHKKSNLSEHHVDLLERCPGQRVGILNVRRDTHLDYYLIE